MRVAGEDVFRREWRIESGGGVRFPVRCSCFSGSSSMRRFTLRSVASSLALLFSAAGLLRGAEEPQPIRVLLITGGCCHDYAVQKDLLKKGLEARAHVVVDQVHTDDKSTKPPLAIFGNPDYANGYNVVVHDECAAALADPAIIRQVLAPHRAGIPGVNLHCAVHSYRIGDQKVPAEAGSERAMWFDYLGIQSSQHGPKLPIPVTTLNDKHPIIAGLNFTTTSFCGRRPRRCSAALRS
jgi:hypothetical protein